MLAQEQQLSREERRRFMVETLQMALEITEDLEDSDDEEDIEQPIENLRISPSRNHPESLRSPIPPHSRTLLSDQISSMAASVRTRYPALRDASASGKEKGRDAR